MLRLTAPLLQDYAYIAERMREDERAQFVAMSGAARYDADACALAAANAPGPKWLHTFDGEPVLIGGFESVRPGVYIGWHMALEGAWERHWRSFTKTSLRLMDALLSDSAHRIETCALVSRAEAHRWYERIGMTNEGIQRGYCADGQDGVMYARTRIKA